jgi:hypothetical protein
MSEPQGYTQAVDDILNSQLGQSITQAFTAGEEQERERMTRAIVERYPNHIVEVIDRGMGETYKSHDNCPQCVAIALIKGENK